MRFYALFIALLIFIGCNPTSPSEEVEKVGSNEVEIKECFSNYKNAILAANGADAIKCIDKTTKLYYERIADLAQKADSNTLQSLSLMDKLMILTVRHRIIKEDILKMNGEGLLKYTIENKMMGTGQLQTSDIGNISISDTTAKGELFFSGQGSTIFFNFHKEKDDWKIDITSIFEVSNNSLLKIVEDNNRTHEEFIMETLENTTGIIPSPTIWMPIRS